MYFVSLATTIFDRCCFDSLNYTCFRFHDFEGMNSFARWEYRLLFDRLEKIAMKALLVLQFHISYSHADTCHSFVLFLAAGGGISPLSSPQLILILCNFSGKIYFIDCYLFSWKDSNSQSLFQRFLVFLRNFSL